MSAHRLCRTPLYSSRSIILVPAVVTPVALSHLIRLLPVIVFNLFPVVVVSNLVPIVTDLLHGFPLAGGIAVVGGLVHRSLRAVGHGRPARLRVLAISHIVPLLLLIVRSVLN